MLKRMILWVLTGMLVLAAAAGAQEEGALYAVRLLDGAYLTDAQGRETAEGEYRTVYELADGVQLFAAEQVGGEFAGYALIDGEGKQLTGFEYQVLEYADGKIPFMKGERWGVMDEAGNILTEAAYTALVSNGRGGFLALKTDPYDDLPDSVCLIDESGAEQETGVKVISWLYAMTDGLLAAVSAENGLYGYLNADGQWALPPEYRWAGAFADGWAHAMKDNAGGLIDTQGNWVLESEYNYINCSGKDSMIVAGKGNGIQILHPGTLEKAAEFSAEGAYAFALENGGAVVSWEDRAVLIGMDGKATELEGCKNVSQWGGMNGQIIVQMGEYGTPSSYLYNLDGEAIAGPYQDIVPLGAKDGEMYYVFTMFESEQVEYGQGIMFWDEIPGTRRCGVLAPDGEEICVFEADYISYVGADRMLIQQKEAALFADFAGNVYREFSETAASEGE